MPRIVLGLWLLTGLALASPAPAVTRRAAGAASVLEEGRRLDDRNETALAIARYRSAAALAQATRNTALEVEARSLLGTALAVDGRQAEGRAELERARALADAANDARGRALANFGLGRVLWYSDLEEARRRFRAALSGFEAVGDEVEQARTIGPLLGTGLPDEEEQELGRRGLEFARRRGEPEIEARILASLGENAREKGNFREAIRLLEEARALVAGKPHSKTLGLVCADLGSLHQNLGDFDAALAYLRRAAAVRRRLPRAYAQTVLSLAATLHASGRLAEAEKDYERAAALALAAASPRIVTAARMNLADLRLQRHEPRLAVADLEKLLAECRDPDLRVQLSISLSDGYIELGRTGDAERLLDGGLADPRRREDLEVRVYGVLTRAHLRSAQKRDDEALQELQDGRDFLAKRRAQLVSEDALKQIYSFDQMLFAGLVDQLTLMGLHAAALEAAEEARARAFLDLLATSRRDSACEGRPATFEEIVNAASRLQSTIVSYFVTTDATFIWVVSPKGIAKAVRVPEGKRRLAALVASANERKRAAAWRELHDVLIEPVRDALPASPGSRLTIVPHGPLVLLPFAALRAKSGRYLLEDHAIHYTPAVGLFSFTKASERAAGGPTLVVADPSPLPDDSRRDPLSPLPGARREARIVRELRPAVKVLAGTEATKDALRSGADGATVLHLATHAVIRDDQPAESFLALSTADGGDGMLTAREIYDLRLRADLVVLSSCRSALGKVSPDGVLGLTRAFLSAGASSIVAATWDVADDVQGDLIRPFYEGERDGTPRDMALRDAQLRLLGRLRKGRVRVRGPLGPAPAAPDPFLWAGLVLVGEP